MHWPQNILKRSNDHHAKSEKNKIIPNICRYFQFAAVVDSYAENSFYIPLTGLSMKFYQLVYRNSFHFPNFHVLIELKFYVFFHLITLYDCDSFHCLFDRKNVFIISYFYYFFILNNIKSAWQKAHTYMWCSYSNGRVERTSEERIKTARERKCKLFGQLFELRIVCIYWTINCHMCNYHIINYLNRNDHWPII